MPVIGTFAAALAGMGISGNLVPVLVVPLAVIVLHLGVKTFCKRRRQDYGNLCDNLQLHPARHPADQRKPPPGGSRETRPSRNWEAR